MTELELREFYATHYPSASGWVVEELHLKVFVPTKDPGTSADLIREILDEAAFDIRTVAVEPGAGEGI